MKLILAMFFVFSNSYAQEEEAEPVVKVKIVQEESKEEVEEPINNPEFEENAQEDSCGATIQDIKSKEMEGVKCFNPTSERCGDYVEVSDLKVRDDGTENWRVNRCTSILKSNFHDKWVRVGDE